jgi:hypothetical protein
MQIVNGRRAGVRYQVSKSHSLDLLHSLLAVPKNLKPDT